MRIAKVEEGHGAAMNLPSSFPCFGRNIEWGLNADPSGSVVSSRDGGVVREAVAGSSVVLGEHILRLSSC